ncbi:hypothetical protein LEN26_004651, partial [Aphanomyces euteiches]
MSRCLTVISQADDIIDVHAVQLGSAASATSSHAPAMFGRMAPVVVTLQLALRATTGIAHPETNATESLYNGLLSSVIAGFQDIFRPRLENPATASFILVQAIVHGKVYQVEWMMGHHSFELCASYLLIDIAAWAGQLE